MTLKDEFDAPARGAMILSRFKINRVYCVDASQTDGLFRASRDLGFGEDLEGINEAIYLLTGERVFEF